MSLCRGHFLLPCLCAISAATVHFGTKRLQKVRNLPNYITVFRLLLSPVFIAFFLVDRPWGAICALGIAVIFEITDLLDGFIARRYKMVSSLGKLIDPLADSVARFSVFLALTAERSVREHPWPVLLVAFVFYRDAIVAYVRTLAASTGTVLAARLSGKIKAVVQGAGIFIFLAIRVLSYFDVVSLSFVSTAFYLMMIPVLSVTVWSAVDYLRPNWGALCAMSKRGREAAKGQADPASR